MIAILGGTIINGTGETPIKDGVILIEGKRIVAVGDASTTIPSEATRISAAGKYIIPGLMDSNVHLVADVSVYVMVRYEGKYEELAIEAAQLSLKAGVTTVFDSWGPRAPLVKARNAINEGRAIGSRIYCAGNIVGFGGPFSEDFFAAGKDALYDEASNRINAIWEENVGPELMSMSRDQVREELRKYVQKEIDFVKYSVTVHDPGARQYLFFSPQVQQIIVEEAHRAGITVQTHTTSIEGAQLAVEAGVDMMQHIEITGPTYSMPKELVELIVKRRMPGSFLAHTQKFLDWCKAHSPESYYKWACEIADINERALIQAGAIILLSTDAGVFSSNTKSSPQWSSSQPPDEGLLDLGEGHFNWLLAVEQKGMKPMNALIAATRDIARTYKVDNDLGTLERGKIADLVILDKNPLDSAANYRSIHLVMKEGSTIDLNALPTHRFLTA